MYFFSHLFMAKVLYRQLADEVELDHRAFSYGNIKPDLPSPERMHHTLEQCIFTVYEKTRQLTEEDMTVTEYSECLGEVCHYISDFFCYYHTSEEIHNRNLPHFLYELRLHLELFRLQRKGHFHQKPEFVNPQKDIHSMILSKRREYFTLPRSMSKDIDFALETALWASRYIIYRKTYSVIETKSIEKVSYSLLT